MTPIPPHTPSGGGGPCDPCDPCEPCECALEALHVAYDAGTDTATFTSDVDMSTVNRLSLYGGSPGGGFYYVNDLNPGNFTIVDAHTITITQAMELIFGQPFQLNWGMVFDDNAPEGRPLAIYAGESIIFAAAPLIDTVTAPSDGTVHIDGTGLSSADSIRYIGENNLDATIYSPFGSNSGFNAPYPNTQIPQWNFNQLYVYSNALDAHSGDELQQVELRDSLGTLLLSINTNVVLP